MTSEDNILLFIVSLVILSKDNYREEYYQKFIDEIEFKKKVKKKAYSLV
jgi:hypothetical protein